MDIEHRASATVGLLNGVPAPEPLTVSDRPARADVQKFLSLMHGERTNAAVRTSLGEEETPDVGVELEGDVEKASGANPEPETIDPAEVADTPKKNRQAEGADRSPAEPNVNTQVGALETTEVPRFGDAHRASERNKGQPDVHSGTKKSLSFVPDESVARMNSEPERGLQFQTDHVAMTTVEKTPPHDIGFVLSPLEVQGAIRSATSTTEGSSEASLEPRLDAATKFTARPSALSVVVQNPQAPQLPTSEAAPDQIGRNIASQVVSNDPASEEKGADNATQHKQAPITQLESAPKSVAQRELLTVLSNGGKSAVPDGRETADASDRQSIAQQQTPPTNLKPALNPQSTFPVSQVENRALTTDLNVSPARTLSSQVEAVTTVFVSQNKDAPSAPPPAPAAATPATAPIPSSAAFASIAPVTPLQTQTGVGAEPIGRITVPTAEDVSSSQKTHGEMQSRAEAPIAKGVLAQIREFVGSSNERLTEVRLNPEELGRVRFVFSEGDNPSLVSIQFERAEALEIVRRNFDFLKAELAAAGYNMEHTDLTSGFDGGSQSERFEENEQSAPDETTKVLEDKNDEPREQGSWLRPDGRLDMRA